MNATHNLASYSEIENLQSSFYNSASGSPISTSDRDGISRPNTDGGQAARLRAKHAYQGVQFARDLVQKFAALELVANVLEIQSVLLGHALVGDDATVNLPQTLDSYHPFGLTTSPGQPDTAARDYSFRVLRTQPCPRTANVIHLGDRPEHTSKMALELVGSQAVKWWDEVMNGNGIGIGSGLGARGGEVDEAGEQGHDCHLGESCFQERYKSACIDLSSVLLHLQRFLTLTSLHAEQIDQAHLARLRLLTSDRAPAQHPGTLEIALHCIGVFALK